MVSVNYTTYTLPGTTGTNVTNLGGVLQWANDVTGGAFVPGMLLVSFFVMFSLMSANWSARKAFASTMFILMVITTILRGRALVSDPLMILMIIAFVLGGIWLLFGED